MSQRAFERAVLGAPAVPPGRVTAAANSIRRWISGAHRRAAPPPLQILESLFAQFDAPVLGALVELGIPDHLSEPMSAAELARRTNTDPEKLERLLRYAAARGFVTITGTGLVEATGVTVALRSEAEAPWRAWVEFACSGWFTDAWPGLAASLQTESAPAFDLAHGQDFFTYITETDPAAGSTFDEAMAAGAMLQAIGLARTLDWDGVTSVCDVGGGTGAALEVLQRYRPQLEVTLFDLPEVTGRARFQPSPPARSIESGSFFDAVPPGCDRYLLLSIIHDWDDERADAILRTVSAALPRQGRVIVVETVAAHRPRDDFAAASDLLMFVLASGRERTEEQYDEIFTDAGLHIEKARVLPTGATAFELTPT